MVSSRDNATNTIAPNLKMTSSIRDHQTWLTTLVGVL